LQGMVDGPAPQVKACAAKGAWILDSGASDHLVGKTNLSKKELKSMDCSGPAVLLSTANGLVERSARTRQQLPGSDGAVGEVSALVMDDMDLNIASMGRMIDDKKFVSVWAPGHGHLWRDPDTRQWQRLLVENFGPVLAPHPDQSGIKEALLEILGDGAPIETAALAIQPASETQPEGTADITRSTIGGSIGEVEATGVTTACG
jgi:hypothetical protein